VLTNPTYRNDDKQLIKPRTITRLGRFQNAMGERLQPWLFVGFLLALEMRL